MPRLKIGLFYLFAITLLCGVALGADFYVDAKSGSDSNAGTSPDEAWLTIRHALASVSGSQRDPVTVHVAAGTYSASTNGERFPFVLKSYVSLLGAGGNTTILDAEGEAFHVIIASFIDEVGIEGLTIKGGKADGLEVDERGAGIYFESCSDQVIRDCGFTGNTARKGAGIYAELTSLTIQDSEFRQNLAVMDEDFKGLGAGISCTQSTIAIDSCTFDGNEARMGGGICCVNSGGSITGCTFSGNVGIPDSNGTSLGGGIFGHYASLTVENCMLAENSACIGSGMAFQFSPARIVSCDVVRNVGAPDASERSWGAGMCCYDSSPLVSDCTFSENAACVGAALCLELGSAVIEDCTIADNVGVADVDGFSVGGGISCSDALPTIRRSSISGNSASWGGAVALFGASSATIADCDVLDNTAVPNSDGQSWGGGMFISESSPTVRGCTVSGNTAWSGGGIFLEDSSPIIADCELVENEAVPDSDGYCYGGGLHSYESSPTIENCSIMRNSGRSGAGIKIYGGVATVTSCRITGNHGTPDANGRSYGGGLDCGNSELSLLNSTVSENSAWSGAGIYCTNCSPAIRNCQIEYNSGQFSLMETSWGGGIDLYGSSPRIENCQIVGNSAWSGGGIASENYSRPIIVCCMIVGNRGESDSDGESYGGGVDIDGAQAQMEGCVVVDNTAAWGGGIGCMDGSYLSAFNCLVAQNTAIKGGGGIYCNSSGMTAANFTISGNEAQRGGGIRCYDSQSAVVGDSILWGNSEEVSLGGSSSITLRYSCVQGSYAGLGNISADPLFVAGPLGDYYLSCRSAGQDADSPCIDRGKATAESLGLDKFTTRTDCVPDSGTVDMGYHSPLAADQNPTIECSLNDNEFSPGESLVALYDVDNPGPDITVDVYFAFVMPDGAILCISPTRIDFGIFPCMTDLFLHQGYSMESTSLLSITVPGGLPVGNYLFAGALSEPGRFEVVGDISLFEFVLR